MSTLEPHVIGRQSDGTLLIGLDHMAIITHEIEGGAFHTRIGSAYAHTRWNVVNEPIPAGLISDEDLAQLKEREIEYLAWRRSIDTPGGLTL
ncbi:hypothetical protein OG884_33695 [Streptosporangium sp. NBC_01755]|uniref:hypothetical protein n=1 Tax=unclassified Streptosporangium TaxID=2632669 RepID=UPI002DD88151|nr:MULTISPECIES: hypothetical protein [unclassified Streptosporangium]WSA28850.1 hypothetical protein OIE13_13790 [Streptosporangium sp. NBC_01810]WSC99704.1 hypothetical protein OG884_33695 [Streptosporangium sp. NBC_01755]